MSRFVRSIFSVTVTTFGSKSIKMEDEIIANCIESFVKEVKLQKTNIYIHQNCSQGLMGEAFKVTITGFKGEKILKFDLFAKLTPSSKEKDVTGLAKLCFLREIFVYENVIPLFENLNSELSDYSDMFPKYYSSGNSKCVLLKHLAGYTAVTEPKIKKDNTNEILEAIKIIAKMHAFSMLLKMRNPENYKELTKNLKDIYVEDTYYKDSYKNMIDLVFRTANVFLDGDVKTIHERIRIKAFDMFKMAVTNSACKVICHGDCHVRNFLFKYKNNNPDFIEDCKMVDFQLMHTASPAVDLQYLIGSGTSSEQRLNNHNFTELHYKTMTETLRQFNVDIERVYPRQLYEQDIVNTSIIALVTCHQIFVHSLGNPDNMPSLTDFFSGVLAPEKMRPLNEIGEDIEWMRNNMREYMDRYQFS